ncbi:SCY1-like protein 2 [Trichinella britovi]|uniref:SCY1-like protein 2 n=1 Tax=Trichinella britovi TaxID=45882 RepID=A0A0V1CPX4_TRIBR|nr:SCY1-like protein 2 [Trichinella britovi]
MDYFNKLKSTVYSVKATVDSVLPGNALTRDFEWLQHVASAGPGLLWKVYKGYKKNSLAFCTEPIFASLANTLGRIDNMPPTIPAELDSFSFENVEIKHGLLTLLHALSFVHTDAHILHNNICPESIMITKRGCWKLAGFEFCSSCKSSSDQQIEFLDSSDVKCLERLENMCQLNVGEKIEFLNELDNFVGKCSKVKVNALLCIGSIVNSLERWMIMEIVIPTLARINSHEPGVLMVLLGIFQVIFNNKQFNLSKEIMAKYCLPSLLMASVENGLNLVQFESFIKLIKEMLSKIEKDQRLRLEGDTQSLQETFWYGSRLSLEEKKRLAYEQEQELRLRSQAPIIPIIASKEKQAPPTSAFDELSFSLASSLELGGNAKQNTSGNPFRPCWQNAAQQSANSTEPFSETSQGNRCLAQSQPIIPLIPPPPPSRAASSVSQAVKKSNTNLDDPFR